MKQALEALEDAVDHLPKPNSTECGYAITSLRQAIAEAEKQEPVAWIDDEGEFQWIKKIDNPEHTAFYTHPQLKREPLMLEKFREMKALLDDDIHTHKKMFTDDELKIIMETTMPEIDWKARHGVELNNGERNKWMLEWFIAFARAIEAAHGIKETP